MTKIITATAVIGIVIIGNEILSLAALSIAAVYAAVKVMQKVGERV